MEIHDLKGLIEEQRALLNAVAVRAKEIDDVQDEYKERRRTIAAELRRLGLEDPNPFATCGSGTTTGKRISQPGPSVAALSRRFTVNWKTRSTISPIGILERGCTNSAPDGNVDSQLAQLRERYATARTTEDYQAVGLLCRDIVVSLADACYDHERHGEAQEREPSSAMDRLDKVIATEAPGGPNKQLRQLLNSTMELANNVQHDRTGTLDKAAVAAESTVAAVTLLRVSCRAPPQSKGSKRRRAPRPTSFDASPF